MCVGRDAAWLVESVRHGEPAESAQDPSLSGHQREGSAETDPETLGAYKPALCQKQKWFVYFLSAQFSHQAVIIEQTYIFINAYIYWF